MIEVIVPLHHLSKRDGDRAPCPIDSPPEIGSSQSFNVSCGLDGDGADLYRTASPSFSNCVDICANYHPRCFAVAYEASEAHGTDNCYLKDSIPALVSRAFVVDSAVAIWPTDTEEDCDGISSDFTIQGVAFETHCGQDYPYNDYKQGNAASLEDCMGQCATAEENCAGVSYEASMEHGYTNCYLKSAVGVNALETQDFVVDSAFVVKRQSASSSATRLVTEVSSSTTAGTTSTQTPGLRLSLCSATTASNSASETGASTTAPSAEASSTSTGLPTQTPRSKA